MSTNKLGILSRMPWNRYSFVKKTTSNDGMVPNDLKQVLFKDVLNYSSSDVLKLVSLIGKCSCDSSLIYKTDWSNIYGLIYKSISNSTHIWRFNSLVKLIQNASYLCDNLVRKHRDTSFLNDTIRTVTERLGKSINQVGDKDISKLIYSCSKGDFLGNSLISKSFLLLLENEIIQRLNRFEAIDLLKILHSTNSIRKHNETVFEKDFISCICNKILEKISKIGSIDISNLICFLHNNNLLNKHNKATINNNINKRLYGIKDKDLLLSTSLSLVMYNIINLKNMELIIKLLKLHELQAEDIIICKLMIYYLKYNTKVYEELSGADKSYLDAVLSTFVNGISYGLFNRMYSHIGTSASGDILNVNSEVCRLLRMLNYRFIPYLHGPYLLSFYDPFNRVAILTSSASTDATTAINGTSNEWLRRNLTYLNENMKLHLRSEGLKLVELQSDFFALSVYRQIHRLISSINVLYTY
ncbi:conserved hypothetical protein [Theileria orientalis strain Shintoku]|uniref:RAP domain-containing protein n=1 Tax=Theileria orientalis strain Shintoku TaxID=869250 RepID=J4CCD8_THEOR|nr:conserved hypothetical protein [Theileria orientalis strain Shintoku]BAM39217.1 conserved hypothetical protein [Theileria orientalis strain Shintoku]|eukprot:XP_009689518.1 conserved hypothetical protein [Theileria orientalis strain Shintoku]